MAGTIFEHSSTSLRLWYYAMYLMASTRCGISAKQIQRETGVTYKTTWRMFKQIRSLLSETDMQLEGSAVEMDEMYYGGTSKGHSGRPMRGDKQKSPVIGIVERSGKRAGRVKALVTPDVTSERVMGVPSYGRTPQPEVVRAVPDYVTAQPRASVLILTDFTGASLDQEALRAMKETAVFDKAYIKK